MFETLLKRNVDSIYPSKDSLEKKLSAKTNLKIYLGIDPTSPELHLGNAIALWKLKEFQDVGHRVTLLIGDFTGMIGDPSDKSSLRVTLSKKEVLDNAKEYKNQASKILKFSGNNPATLEFNSKWLSKLNFEDIIELTANFTVQQMIERDMFQKKLEDKKPIGIHEFLYPLMQGYDSVALDTDVEIGGTDQTFNMLIGRDLMKIVKNKEKFVLTIPLLEGTDGRKMSKSYGNTINLSDSPKNMYGKVMSIKDELIIKYFKLCTNTSETELEDISLQLENSSSNPMDIKKKLAFEITKTYHGATEAKKAEVEFSNVFQKGMRTKDIEVVELDRSILPKSYAALANASGATTSVSAAVSLAGNKGLRFNGVVISDPLEMVKKVSQTRTVIDIGKRKSVKIVWK